ncbi:MAG: hypothetical protein AAFR77_16485 [Cyanobacteria bacterium J06631_2]
MTTFENIILTVISFLKARFDDHKLIARLVCQPLKIAKLKAHKLESIEGRVYIGLENLDKGISSERIRNPIKSSAIATLCACFLLLVIARDRNPRISQTKDLPEDYIGELEALQRRWQNQGLSQEEIEIETRLCRRDMSIGHTECQKYDWIDLIKNRIRQYLSFK